MSEQKRYVKEVVLHGPDFERPHYHLLLGQE